MNYETKKRSVISHLNKMIEAHSKLSFENPKRLSAEAFIFDLTAYIAEVEQLHEKPLLGGQESCAIKLGTWLKNNSL